MHLCAVLRLPVLFGDQGKAFGLEAWICCGFKDGALLLN